MSSLPSWNLYQRILDDAQSRRLEGDTRRALQIQRIEDKAYGNETAQEQRSGEEGNPEARRTSGL